MKHNIKNRVRNVLSNGAGFASKDKGFTIIEVALVLAIAGLIFLVVFIAWPALQNSQKDTAARQDVNHVVTAVESFKTDNQGTPPGSGDVTSVLNYVRGTNTGTSTGLSTANAISWGGPDTSNKTTVFINATPCSAATASAIGVRITLSSGTVYCANAS